MPVIHLDDGTGETLRVLELNGFYCPTMDCVDNQEGEVRSIPNWAGKPNDVWICAYPKAGTHWLWEVTSMLVNGSADRVKLIKETAMLELVTQEQYNNIDSPRVLNSHLPINMMPKDALKLKNKFVFVQRNIKDVCVSYFNHHSKITEYEYEGKWENYIQRFIKGLVDYGSWFEYTLGWEKVFADNPDLPVHLLSYENMKKDSVTEIRKLAKFLELKVDNELIESIADKTEFSKMKKEKDPLEDTSGWKGGQPGMYRKGQIGDWKNWFTVAQSEQFDAIFAEKMKGSSFTYRYS